MAGRAYIGTSGWNYKEWRHGFYRDVRQQDWLRHCAQHFSAIEVNATFYRLQQKSTFARWREQTPDHFRFAIKANRYLTHNSKLRTPARSIQLERTRALALKEKLTAVVWQMPRHLRKNLPRLEKFARALKRWPEARHVIEFRHDSWFDNDVADCLRRHGLAVCQSDAPDWPLWDAVTSDLVYVRLHGHTKTYGSNYSDKELTTWARCIRRWLKQGHDVHVYFDNTAKGYAVSNALTLMTILRTRNSATAKRHRKRKAELGSGSQKRIKRRQPATNAAQVTT